MAEHLHHSAFKAIRHLPELVNGPRVRDHSELRFEWNLDLHVIRLGIILVVVVEAKLPDVTSDASPHLVALSSRIWLWRHSRRVGLAILLQLHKLLQRVPKLCVVEMSMDVTLLGDRDRVAPVMFSHL